MSATATYAWLWDVDMDAATFDRLLHGETQEHGRDWRWAMIRLIEYAPYDEIRRLLPVPRFLDGWSEIANRVRSASRREGMDYLHAKLLARRNG